MYDLLVIKLLLHVLIKEMIIEINAMLMGCGYDDKL